VAEWGRPPTDAGGRHGRTIRPRGVTATATAAGAANKRVRFASSLALSIHGGGTPLAAAVAPTTLGGWWAPPPATAAAAAAGDGVDASEE